MLVDSKSLSDGQVVGWRLKGVARTCLAWQAHGIRMPRMLFHHPTEYLWGQEKATERQGTWLIGEEDSWQLEKGRRSLPPHIERFTFMWEARLEWYIAKHRITGPMVGDHRKFLHMMVNEHQKHRSSPDGSAKIAWLTMLNFGKWKPIKMSWKPTRKHGNTLESCEN